MQRVPKLLASMMMIITILIIAPVLVSAQAAGFSHHFCSLFNEHKAVMLLIDPHSGAIIDANKAAIDFYGYSKGQLLGMNVEQINVLEPGEIEQEMQAATAGEKERFLFKHQLADGEVRHVEVYSYPIDDGGEEVLFSIVHDVTEKTLLKERTKAMTDGIFIAGGLAIAILLLLVVLLVQNYKELKVSKSKVENLQTLQEDFLNANENLMYLKDENLRYVFVNQAVANLYQKKAEEIIGREDYELSISEFARKRRKTDLDVLKKETLIVDEIEWEDRILRSTKFPVRMLNGKFGVGAYVSDVTEERERGKEREKDLRRYKIMTNILTHDFQNSQQELDYALHKALQLTESQYGYIYIYDEDKRELTLNSWTRGVMKSCEIADKKTVYQLEKTGIWGEVIRQRKPMVVNNFEQPHPLKKGYPQGHVVLKKWMSVPVIIDEKIVAVVGLANKNKDYDANDVHQVTLFMNGVWHALQRKEAQEKLALERNKYLQTLISIGDGVMVVDTDGRVEMLNGVAEKLTGWPNAEAQGRHYGEICVLSHEREGMVINDPIAEALATDEIVELGNHAILSSRDGSSYYLEDSAAPIKDKNNKTIGVVMVFRDVTEKRDRRKKIEYLSRHDLLTGLYNQQFFNEELRRFDTEDNLPLAVIIGDVNCLKLTNDIFGHAYGDRLLQKVGAVLRRVCRTDDIVARWGGDEFAILLPRTTQDSVRRIMERIKAALAQEQVKAIKGSISLGASVKYAPSNSLLEVLSEAEERMYEAKALEHKEVRINVLNTIITNFYENNLREKEHSLRVSKLCLQLGQALGLPKDEIHKLERAGYLHDIGKIVLEPEMLSATSFPDSYKEYELRKHVVAGYRVLNSFEDTVDLAEIVLAHHEHWDGSGYPRNLKGEEIPLPARIIRIAGSLERLLYDDQGQKAMSKEEAVKHISAYAGTQFDPQLVKLLAKTAI